MWRLSCSALTAVLLGAAVSSTAATTKPPKLTCTDCSAPSKALWWTKTGLNCPAGAPAGSCDICDQTQQQHVCATATTPDACCQLCQQWNSDTLPHKDAVGAKSGRWCTLWYFNGQSCFLKDGCATKEECGAVPGDSSTPICLQRHQSSLIVCPWLLRAG
jgi:hypothetical protein